MSFTDQFDLHGQTALVTGATRGIGKSMAIALAEAGSDIILTQRNDSNTSTRDEIRALGRAAIIYTADLAQRDQIKGLVKRVLEDGHDISILINCGGIQRRHPAEQFPDEDWDEVWTAQFGGIPLSTADDCIGHASEPRRSLYPGTRYRCLHAHEAAKGQPAVSRFDHQRSLTGVLPGRAQRACICSGERRCRTAHEISIQSMGIQRDQRQCRETSSLHSFNTASNADKQYSDCAGIHPHRHERRPDQ